MLKVSLNVYDGLASGQGQWTQSLLPSMIFGAEKQTLYLVTVSNSMVNQESKISQGSGMWSKRGSTKISFWGWKEKELQTTLSYK
jgi:hypothetical protein